MEQGIIFIVKTDQAIGHTIPEIHRYGAELKETLARKQTCNLMIVAEMFQLPGIIRQHCYS